MISALKRIALKFFLGTSLLAVACSSGIVKSLNDLAKLRQQLTDKYQEKDINVNLQDSRFLSVSFVNSALNQRGTSERKNRAYETVMYVKSHYPGINGIQSILIAFVRSETRFIVFHYTDIVDTFAFDRNGSEIGARTEEEDVHRPVARFSAPRNETDVSITRLQLEGDMNHGIAMVPHYTVAGDINNSARKLAAPQLVTLEFASYAEKKVFPANARLLIEGDGKTIFSGSARLLNSADAGTAKDSLPQFLNAQIPFSQFVRIPDSNKVRLTLGPKVFLLSAEDLDSLHEMGDYVAAPNGK